MQNSVRIAQCTTCGKQVSEGSKFCTFCGAATEQRSAAGQVGASGLVEMNWERLAVRGLGPGAMVHRARVPGGWLVWVTERESLAGSNYIPSDAQLVRQVLSRGGFPTTVPVGFSGLTFLPDPNHSWDGE